MAGLSSGEKIRMLVLVGEPRACVDGPLTSMVIYEFLFLQASLRLSL